MKPQSYFKFLEDENMYEIKGIYNGNTEVIDTTDDKNEAVYLVGEYIMAFGSEWDIWFE